MALDPYRRKLKGGYRRGVDDVPTQSRVPMIVGAVGLLGLLALVYNLSVTSIGGSALDLFASYVQSPP